MSAPDRFLPGRLWSLWDMVNLQLGQLVLLIRRLEVNRLGLKDMNSTGRGSEQIDQIHGAAIQGNLQLADLILTDHLSDANIAHALRRFSDSVGRVNSNSEVYSNIVSLSQALEVALKERIAFIYPKDKGSVFYRWSEDWGDVRKQFPSAVPDIISGVDCYALGHNTACVFHMSRIAEIGLRAIGRERGISKLDKKSYTIEWATWGEIIGEIEKRTEEIRLKNKRGSNKEAASQFYNSIISDVRAIQSMYRDPSMHFRDLYDDGEAQSAMFRARSFMTMLAGKLSEGDVGPIDWGFEEERS